MSVLIRTGNNINDVEWTNNLLSGNKIFLDNKTWKIVESGQSYNCLQRIGDKIIEVDYRNVSNISNNKDLASILDTTEKIILKASNGEKEINIDCVAGGFIESTLDLIENGNSSKNSNLRKGFMIDFVFNEKDINSNVDMKLAELKLKLINKITIYFEDGTNIEIPTIDTVTKNNVVSVYHLDSWVKYNEWLTKPQVPTKIVF